jgi:hypothetical protein
MRSFLFVLAACGSSGSDAPVDASSVDAAVPCLVSANYADLGTKTGSTSQGPATLTIVLDAGPPRDSFFIKLNAGKGVFAAGLANGTYPIANAELSLATCGLCVNLIADIVTGQGPSGFYFATGGSVTLTSTQPPAGTLTNITLHEVTSDGTPVNSGCTSKIGTMQFSGT